MHFPSVVLSSAAIGAVLGTITALIMKKQLKIKVNKNKPLGIYSLRLIDFVVMEYVKFDLYK